MKLKVQCPVCLKWFKKELTFNNPNDTDMCSECEKEMQDYYDGNLERKGG